MRKKIKKLMLRHREPIRWKSLLKTHILFFGIGCLLYFAFHLLALEFYNFKEIAIEDIDFSDLYYQQQNPVDKSDIIIINSGSIPKEKVFGTRRGMKSLLEKINDRRSCEPEVIGIDLEYTEPKDKAIDSMLQTLFTEKNIVIAESKQDPTIFPEARLGFVNLPDGEDRTSRRYYNYYKQNGKYQNSFARECLSLEKHHDSIFHLKYYCKEAGFYNVLKKEHELDTIFAFPAVEASTIINDSLSPEAITKLFDKKIVLIGHLGLDFMHNKNDVTDKHKTPTDMEFIFRKDIMPGVIIHANAIKQLKLNDRIICVNSVPYLLILYLITLYFFSVFVFIDQFESVFFQLFLELVFLIANVIFINFLCVQMLGCSLHINSIYIAITLLFLIELKSFFMHFYEHRKHKAKKHKKH